MSFQESGFQITQKVFDACGKPDYLASRSKREAEAAAAAAGNDRSGSGRAISLDDGNRQRLQGVGHPETRKELEVEVSTSQPIQSKGKSDFERMMEDLRRVVRIHFGLDFLPIATIFSPVRFAIPKVFGGTCRTECALTRTRRRRAPARSKSSVTAFDSTRNTVRWMISTVGTGATWLPTTRKMPPQTACVPQTALLCSTSNCSSCRGSRIR